MGDTGPALWDLEIRGEGKHSFADAISIDVIEATEAEMDELVAAIREEKDFWCDYSSHAASGMTIPEWVSDNSYLAPPSFRRRYVIEPEAAYPFLEWLRRDRADDESRDVADAADEVMRYLADDSTFTAALAEAERQLAEHPSFESREGSPIPIAEYGDYTLWQGRTRLVEMLAPKAKAEEE